MLYTRVRSLAWLGALWTAVFGASAQTPVSPAGSMLLVVGTVQVERNGERTALRRGDDVRPGDLIIVGDRSNAQIRFTDASLIALRAGTQFRIDTYRFAEGGRDARMDVALVKGSLRAVTGLIGRQQPEAFSTRTPTATVGIRGTHFALRHCAGECVTAQGEREPDGTYGAVNDGTIFAANQGGTRDFSQHQYFYVRDERTAPRRLLAPPAVLDDRQLEIRGLSPTRIPSSILPDAPSIRQPGTTHVPGPDNRFEASLTDPGWNTGGSWNELQFPPLLRIDNDNDNNNITGP